MTWNQAQKRAKQLRAVHPDAHPSYSYYHDGWCVQWYDKKARACGHDYGEKPVEAGEQ